MLRRPRIQELSWEIQVLELLEQRVYAVMSLHSVPTELWQYYMGFAKRLWAHRTRVGSDTFTIEAESLIYEYKERGLDETVLRDIVLNAEETAMIKTGQAPLYFYACIGDSNGSWVARISVAAFETDAWLQIPGHFYPISCAVDPEKRYLYVGHDELPQAAITKIDLATFQIVSTLTLDADDDDLDRICVHNGKLYVSCRTSPARLVKIDLATFTREDHIDLLAGENRGYDLVPVGDKLYWSLGIQIAGAPIGRIAKIDLPSFTRETVLTLQAGDVWPYVMEHYGGHLFAGMYQSPIRVTRISLDPFARVDHITLETAERYARASDKRGRFMYIGTDAGWQRIIEVSMDPFERVKGTALGAADDTIYSLIHRDKYLYAGQGFVMPSRITKVNLDVLLWDDALQPVVAGRFFVLSEAI